MTKDENQESEFPRINIQLRKEKALYAFLDQACEDEHKGRGALAATLLENIVDVARGKKPLKGTLLYTLIYEAVDALATTTTIVQVPASATPPSGEEEEVENTTSPSHEINTMARGLGNFHM